MIREADEEINRLRKGSIDFVAKHFSEIKNTSKNYWYHYYILAQVTLKGQIQNDGSISQWKIKNNTNYEPNEDENFLYFKKKDDLFREKMNECKNETLNYLLNKLNISNEWKEDINSERRTLELRDFDHNSRFVKLILKNSYYKIIENKLPKGIVQHLHWSAGFTSKTIFKALTLFLKKESIKKNMAFLIRVQFQKKDKSFENENRFIDYNVGKYFIIDNYKNVLGKIRDKKDICQEILSNDENNRYLYLLNCKNVRIYSLDSKKLKKIMKEFSDIIYPLDNFLSDFKNSNVLETNKNLILKNLPKSYRNNIWNYRELMITAVWYRFEHIFDMYDDLFSRKEIADNLDEISVKIWKKQKVSGVEYRQKFGNLSEKISNDSKKEKIKYAFIMPGVKSNNFKINKYDILKSDKFQQINTKFNSKNGFTGFDFHGFEDDPFNGARNFIPLSIQKILNQNEEDKFSPILESNLLMPMYLHAGETTFFPKYPVDNDFLGKYYVNDNLFHALLLPNIPRIGHGLAVERNDLILAIMILKNIAMESCPASNEFLKYTYVFQHPFLKFLRMGLKITVNPDDPGLFGYMGVAFDWFKILMETDIKPSEIYLLLKYSFETSSIVFSKDELKFHIQKMTNELKIFFNNLHCEKLGYENLILTQENIEKRKMFKFLIKNKTMNFSKKTYDVSVYDEN